MNLLRHTPYLQRVVGIATEGELRRRLRSEDLLYAEQLAWTPEEVTEAEHLAEGMDIFRNGPPTDESMQHFRPFEYPPSHHPSVGGQPVPYAFVPEDRGYRNRKERRAAKSRRRRI